MKRFARLVELLETAPGPANRISLLAGYFQEIPDDEKTIAIRFLHGLTPRGRLGTGTLKEWVLEVSGFPEWLLSEAAKVSGDTAETLALLLPGKGDRPGKSLVYWAAALDRLPSMNDKSRKTLVCRAWEELGPPERFIFNKLLGGRFRPPVSPGILVAALSQLTGIDPAVLTWRLHSGKSASGGISYPVLAAPETAADTRARPYPFQDRASEIKPDQAGTGTASSNSPPANSAPQPAGRHWLERRLGPAHAWTAERKWTGIPAQIVYRAGKLHVWAIVSRRDEDRGSELVTDYFPELHNLAEQLPDDTVLEGELLGLGRDKLLLLPAFGLEKRIGRKSLPKSLLDQLPATFMAGDCLEYRGRDVRGLPRSQRRALLESLTDGAGDSFRLAPQLLFRSWQQLATEHERIRESGAEGILLSRHNAVWNSGKTDGPWLWKAVAHTFRGVLLYARRQGTGPYTHFSLGAWDQGRLQSFATVEPVLDTEEFAAIVSYVEENTTERFGPVRTVKPGIVLEIAFDEVRPSARHRSGLQLHGARMLRWLKGVSAEEAGMLKSLRFLYSYPA